MARHKDMNVDLPEGRKTPTTTVHEWDVIKTALLMDLRDELKQQNSVQGDILRVLKRMDRRMAVLASLRRPT